jgi:hypothetical protein
MKALLVTVEALAPLLLGRPDSSPNTVESYDYLPGAAVRGALYAAPELATLRDALDTGALKCLPGYPVSGGRRATPLPFSWFRDKETSGLAEVTSATSKFPSTPVTAVGPGFFDLETSSSIDVTLDMSVHNRRSRQYGRAVGPEIDPDDPGAIFRYVTIAPRQRFQTALIGEEKRLEEAQRLLPATTLFFGRARRTRGAAAVVDVSAGTAWPALSSRWSREDGLLRLMLLSPLLVRDTAGLWSSRPDPEELKKGLGVSTLAFRGAALRTETVGGFNQAWGFPRERAVAISAGSVFEYEFTGTITAAGPFATGERQEDGFGCIGPVPPLPSNLQRRTADVIPSASVEPVPSLEGELGDLATLIAGRIRRRLLDDLALDEARAWRVASGKLTRSTISRLRQSLAAALISDEPARRFRSMVEDYRGTARNALDGCVLARDGGVSCKMLQWVRADWLASALRQLDDTSAVGKRCATSDQPREALFVMDHVLAALRRSAN